MKTTAPTTDAHLKAILAELQANRLMQGKILDQLIGLTNNVRQNTAFLDAIKDKIK